MNPKNLHIRFLYQIHLREAKGASEKTIDEVVAAIAEFEAFTRHRGFDRLQKRHSQAFKQHLMERSSKADDRPLAKSFTEDADKGQTFVSITRPSLRADSDGH